MGGGNQRTNHHPLGWPVPTLCWDPQCPTHAYLGDFEAVVLVLAACVLYTHRAAPPTHKTHLEMPSKTIKKDERTLYRQFVDVHNGMVTTMNNEFERSQKAHQNEIDARNQEYKACLNIMRSCAMHHLGGSKTSHRFRAYDSQVDEAMKKYKKKNPKKVQTKRMHKFERMATFEEGEGEEEEAVGSESETPEDEPSDEASDEESEEGSEEESSEESGEDPEPVRLPVRVPAKKLTLSFKK
jgi:hypothetical protein